MASFRLNVYGYTSIFVRHFYKEKQLLLLSDCCFFSVNFVCLVGLVMLLVQKKGSVFKAFAVSLLIVTLLRRVAELK